jgi:hypothetical protein
MAVPLPNGLNAEIVVNAAVGEGETFSIIRLGESQPGATPSLNTI